MKQYQICNEATYIRRIDVLESLVKDLNNKNKKLEKISEIIKKTDAEDFNLSSVNHYFSIIKEIKDCLKEGDVL